MSWPGLDVYDRAVALSSLGVRAIGGRDSVVVGGNLRAPDRFAVGWLRASTPILASAAPNREGEVDSSGVR